MFSASGEYIIVSFNHEITILRKDYKFTKSFQSFIDFPESPNLRFCCMEFGWPLIT